MSVFGGDSWGREAEHRKRRAEELIREGVDASAYKKLSNGKFACLVCHHAPILDTPLMLSVHMKGSRHQAAARKLKEREVVRVNEKNKRIAFTDKSDVISSSSSHRQERRSAGINATNLQCGVIKERQDVPSGACYYAKLSSPSDEGPSVELEAAHGEAPRHQIDYNCLEKELKFTASGWKRDYHGRWFKDENVEFDSDEEDPNVYFAR